jgi:Cof subfamily protein (haloacid dehalogenase superfamily)
MDPKKTIIFSDMDGTLLTSWDLGPVIPTSNLTSIKKWLDLGGMFSVATGRNLKNVPQYFTDFKITTPLVLVNGSLIYSQIDNKVLYQKKISDLFLYDAINYFKKSNYVCLVLSNHNEVYSVVHEHSIFKPIIDFPHQDISLEDIRNIEVLKISFVVAEQYADIVHDEINNLKYIKEVNVLPSAKRFIEVVNNTSTKSTGIKRAIEIAKLTDKTIVCIGDYLNDLEMFEIADIKAAPINGHEDVKKSADIITRSNNDGAISDLINKLLN